MLARTGTNGTNYRDPNPTTPYGQGGLTTPNTNNNFDASPAYSDTDGNGWGSEWDKRGDGYPDPSPSKEAGLVVKEAPNAVEEVPTTRTRRIWLWVVWGMTWYIPSFLLHKIGRMKRADVRLAWREKLTIFLLIFLLNGIVIFYIVEFGRLLCPNFDKAWKANEVAQHTGEDDFWVAVQGQVYDMTNFIHGDHSDITGISSNGADALEVLAGQDLTYYFPPPLVLGCPGLVTDANQALLYANFTADIPQAVHTSGTLQSAQNTNTSCASMVRWQCREFSVIDHRRAAREVRDGRVTPQSKNYAGISAPTCRRRRTISSRGLSQAVNAECKRTRADYNTWKLNL